MKKAAPKWFAFDFDGAAKIPSPTATNNKTKVKTPQTAGTQKTSSSTTRNSSFNFEAKLAPTTVSDLAVHPKKIKEVESWLCDVTKGAKLRKTTAFLLVTGPTGSGKSATVKVLCKQHGLTLSEWVNPMDQDFEITRGPNQVAKFAEFLLESKWGSLFSENENRIIVVEEFPNALVRNPGEFQNVLEDCYYKGNHAIVFICTDSFNSGINLSQSLFPQEVRDKYGITQISFNSCASTIMKTALKRARNLVQENPKLFQIPSPDTVDAIMVSSMGDIRSAVNQFYLASLLGSADLPTVAEKFSKQTGTKRKRNPTPTLSLMSRDENLGLFHSLGRVLNPKRVATGNSWRLNCDVSKLVEEFSIQPGIYTSFLFENYIKYFGDINDACEAVEILSLSQVFLEKWIDRHDTMVFALWVSVLGLMICNRHKVSRWNQIKGPRKINKRTEDVSTRHLSTTDLFYYNIITKQNQNVRKLV